MCFSSKSVSQYRYTVVRLTSICLSVVDLNCIYFELETWVVSSNTAILCLKTIVEEMSWGIQGYTYMTYLLSLLSGSSFVHRGSLMVPVPVVGSTCYWLGYITCLWIFSVWCSRISNKRREGKVLLHYQCYSFFNTNTIIGGTTTTTIDGQLFIQIMSTP